LRTVVIAAVTWIGYSTQTALIERVTIVTFLCQFFSTAFILLLVNADLKEQPFSFGIVYGDSGDFNSGFFKQAGEVLISTMIFNALYPLLDFAINWAIRFIFRLLDRGFTRNRFSTKQTSIQGYVNIYSGPVYLMHYKYSMMLNTIFVTFMYGFGLPLLFPVAVLAMTVLYFVEKTMLYYAYQQPPMYDDRLHTIVMRIA
jgi:hypothetical protein